MRYVLDHYVAYQDPVCRDKGKVINKECYYNCKCQATMKETLFSTRNIRDRELGGRRKYPMGRMKAVSTWRIHTDLARRDEIATSKKKL